MDEIINFAGTLDLTSDKDAFIIRPYTANGPASPHSLLFAGAATSANTSLTLPGKGLVNYGELINRDLVYLLENFSANIPPTYPTVGQLWHKFDDGVMWVCTNPTSATPGNGEWKWLQMPSGTTAPDGSLGALWYDENTNQYKTYNGTSWSNLFAPLNNYLLKSGGTMTGNLILDHAPTTTLEAATKGYVDSAVSGSITMADVQPLLDAKLNLAGGTMTGNLILAHAPTTTLEAATKGYVDSAVATTQPLLDAKLNLAGGTMTGNLILAHAPTTTLEAATKGYVDSAVSGLGGGGGATSLLDLTDVSVTTLLDGDILQFSYVTSLWENKQPADLGLVPTSHLTVSNAHAAEDISLSSTTFTSTNVKDGLEELQSSALIVNGQLTGDLDVNYFSIDNTATPTTNFQVANKQYVDMTDAICRRVTSVTSATDVSTPAYQTGTNGIDVHLNGVKQYGDTCGGLTINVTQVAKGVHAGTGLTDDTSAYQTIQFSPDITQTTNTNLVAGTTYTATITVDGIAHLVSVLGSAVTTYGLLLLKLNEVLAGVATATINAGDIRITSLSKGPISTVVTTAGTLFAPPLNQFSSVVTGAENTGTTTMYTTTLSSVNTIQISSSDSTNDIFVLPGNWWKVFTPGQTFAAYNAAGTSLGTFTVDTGGSLYAANTDTTTVPVVEDVVGSSAAGGWVNITKSRPIAVRGGAAQTYGDLLDLLQMGIREVSLVSNVSASTFTITGNYTTVFVAGHKFYVQHAPTYNAIYTVVSSALSSGKTVITVAETIPANTTNNDVVVANDLVELDIAAFGNLFFTTSTAGQNTTVTITTLGTLWSSLTGYTSSSTFYGVDGPYIESLLPSISFADVYGRRISTRITFRAPVTGSVEVCTRGISY